MIARSLIILSLLSVVVAGCSAKVDGGSSPTPISLDFGGGTPAAKTLLEGTWSSDCMNSNGLYLSMTVTYAGNKSSGTFKLFQDSNCSQVIQQQSQSGVFKIGDKSSVPGAINIDYVSTKGEATYDIFKLDGDTLYFGVQPGASPSTRPTQLNLALPLHKN